MKISKIFLFILLCLGTAETIQAQVAGSPYIMRKKAGNCPAPTGTINGCGNIDTNAFKTVFLSSTANISSATWQIFGPVNYAGSGTNTGNIQYTTNGTYTVIFTLTSSGSCITQTTTRSCSFTVSTPGPAAANIRWCNSGSPNYGQGAYDWDAIGGTGTDSVNYNICYDAGNGGFYPGGSFSSGAITIQLDAITLNPGGGSFNAKLHRNNMGACQNPNLNFNVLGTNLNLNYKAQSNNNGCP